MAQFSYGTAAEILRSSQKDVLYTQQLSRMLLDAVNSTFGARATLLYRQRLFALSDMIYYGTTTLSGTQTLGEEYANIVQTIDFKLPSLSNRIFLFCFQVLFPHAYGWLPNLLMHLKMKNKRQQLTLIQSTKRLLTQLSSIGPHLTRLHVALFYFNGNYLTMSKRLTRIRYVNNQPMQAENAEPIVRPSYRILGILLIARSLIELTNFIMSDLEKKRQQTANKSKTNLKSSQICQYNCVLCLNPCDIATITPCGHIFCWNCVANWCATNPACPLCRRAMRPQQLVRMVNV